MTTAPRFVAISHKGGSGKTVLAVNLAGAWAAAGLRVLLVDVDSQGGASRALGIRNAGKPSTAEVLVGRVPAVKAVRLTTTPGLYVLPADLDLASLELELPQQPNWRTALHRCLAGLPDDFDRVVIDTAPGLGVLPFLGLVASDYALVTCPPDYLAWSVLPSVLDVASRAGQLGGGRAQVLGIVPTLVGPKTGVQTELLELMAERHGPLLLPQIPRRVVATQATVAGEPLTTYAPGSTLAATFTALAQEVDRRAQAPQRP